MSGQKGPYFAGVQSGLWRTSVWKTSFWASLALGVVYGSCQLMYFESVALPKFLLQERQKKEKLERLQVEGYQSQINALQARLDTYEPKKQEVVTETVDRFQLNDIENDEVLDKWINYLSEGVDEMGMDDLNFADSA